MHKNNRISEHQKNYTPPFTKHCPTCGCEIASDRKIAHHCISEMKKRLKESIEET